jgi:hypothetical protein
MLIRMRRSVIRGKRIKRSIFVEGWNDGLN